MKTYQFKNEIFEYFNTKMTAEFPTLDGHIFRERLRSIQPEYPFVVLKSNERTRINKRFERYNSGKKTCIKAQYRLPVTFSVYMLSQNSSEAEEFSDNVIDYIEYLFTDCEDTHYTLAEKGIAVNELLNSGVRDLSSFAQTAQEFRKDIDIVFEFEDIQEYSYELGKTVDIDIQVTQ